MHYVSRDTRPVHVDKESSLADLFDLPQYVTILITCLVIPVLHLAGRFHLRACHPVVIFSQAHLLNRRKTPIRNCILGLRWCERAVRSLIYSGLACTVSFFRGAVIPGF